MLSPNARRAKSGDVLRETVSKPVRLAARMCREEGQGDFRNQKLHREGQADLALTTSNQARGVRDSLAGKTDFDLVPVERRAREQSSAVLREEMEVVHLTLDSPSAPLHQLDAAAHLD